MACHVLLNGKQCRFRPNCSFWVSTICLVQPFDQVCTVCSKEQFDQGMLCSNMFVPLVVQYFIHSFPVPREGDVSTIFLRWFLFTYYRITCCCSTKLPNKDRTRIDNIYSYGEIKNLSEDSQNYHWNRTISGSWLFNTLQQTVWSLKILFFKKFTVTLHRNYCQTMNHLFVCELICK